MGSKHRLMALSVNVSQIVAAVLLYLWGGMLMDEGGWISYDNHLTALYSLMGIVAMAIMTYGFIHFCKNRHQ